MQKVGELELVSKTAAKNGEWQGTEIILWVTLFIASTMIVLMAFIRVQHMVIFAILSTTFNIPVVYRYSCQILEEY